MDSANLRQVILGCVRKQTERVSKQRSFIVSASIPVSGFLF